METWWIVEIHYKDHPNSELQIARDSYCPDILSALAHAQRHCQDCWPYEIVGIRKESKGWVCKNSNHGEYCHHAGCMPS